MNRWLSQPSCFPLHLYPGKTAAWVLTSLAFLGGCDLGQKEEPVAKVDEKSSAAKEGAREGASTQAPSKTKSGTPEKKRPSAEEARKLSETLPTSDKVQKVVNPKNRKPYAGPTGSVAGIVRASGDQNLELPEVIANMAANCTTSRKTFGTVLREGEGRTLADVLVAVTEYEGFVPAKDNEIKVEGEGCAWNTRTVAMTFGQTLTIVGKDNRPYVPELLGQSMPAQLFVLPSAPPVKLPPQKPGRFTLVDSMRLYNQAEVFVVGYATHDVTDLDGRFQIDGIPAGKVKINALLPQTMEVVEKEVEILKGKTTELEFTLPFSVAKYRARAKKSPIDPSKPSTMKP